MSKRKLSKRKLSKRKLLTIILVVAGVLLVGALAAPSMLDGLLWRWESNPVLRGRLLAEEQGCLDCHRPFGNTEIPNPGSRWGTVPRFGAGNALMYAEDLDEIEEYIRYGAPLMWLGDPEIADRLARQRLRMPAYGDRLDDGQIADLVLWTALVEGVAAPGESGDDAGIVAAGRALARKHGCLACHGEAGGGGLPNPGGLGGFVPGFLGRNFTDLVADEEEFREWVRTGTLERLASKPWVRWFWERQTLEMPAYGDSLNDEELGQLWTWIQAMRAELGTVSDYP